MLGSFSAATKAFSGASSSADSLSHVDTGVLATPSRRRETRLSVCMDMMSSDMLEERSRPQPKYSAETLRKNKWVGGLYANFLANSDFSEAAFPLDPVAFGTFIRVAGLDAKYKVCVMCCVSLCCADFSLLLHEDCGAADWWMCVMYQSSSCDCLLCSCVVA